MKQYKKIILSYSLLLLCQSSVAMENLVITVGGYDKNNKDLINRLPLLKCSSILGQSMFTKKAVLNENDTSCVFSLLLNTKTNIALVQKDELVFARVRIHQCDLDQIEFLKLVNTEEMFISVKKDVDKIAYKFHALTKTNDDSIIFQAPILSKTSEQPPILNAAQGDNPKNDTSTQSLTFQGFSLTVSNKPEKGRLCENRSLVTGHYTGIEYVLKYNENDKTGAICNGKDEEIATLRITQNEIKEIFTRKYDHEKTTVENHFEFTSYDNNLKIDEYNLGSTHAVYLYFKNNLVDVSSPQPVIISKIKIIKDSSLLFPATLNQPSSFSKKFITPLILGTITIMFMISECYGFSHITKKLFAQ